MTKPVSLLNKFRELINVLLSLHSDERSTMINRRGEISKESSERMEALEDSIRNLGAKYIAAFCDDNKIASSTVYMLFLRKIIDEIRSTVWFPVGKKYAKILHVTMDAERKVIPI